MQRNLRCVSFLHWKATKQCTAVPVRVGGQEHSELLLQDFDLHSPIRGCPGRWPICGKFQGW